MKLLAFLLLTVAAHALTATSTWAGPGGASLLHLPAGDVIAFHAYSRETGKPSLRISPVMWRDGWPTALVDDSAAAPQP